MRASPIVEAIPKETPRESLIPISDTNNPLLPSKKRSKDNQEDLSEGANTRKLKRRDSKRMTTINYLKKEFIMRNVGFSFLMSSSFKKGILEKLKNLQITVKFEVLTRKNLIETLTKGCKIYHMNVELENGTLLLEDELGALERLSVSDIQSALLQDKTYIDILILSSRDGSQLAPFFYSLGIPCIVYFEFKPHENDLFHKHLQDVCMNEFSIQFYEEICNNRSVLEAFNHSKEIMITEIFEKYRNLIQECKMFEKILGVGPKLYPASANILQIQYSKGHIDDISSVKAPTNIEKYDEIILGRKKDLYDIIRTLNERLSVNIYGEKGVGKSKFAKVLGYYMLRLGFKDGVFYFKLGKIRKKFHSDLRELMKTVFGEEFAKEIHCYFKNKKMLLIFDDYDEILKNDSDINSYLHIFFTLKEDNIPYILVTKNKLVSKKAIDKVALHHKLQPLDEAEAKEYLEFKFRELFACNQIEETKQQHIQDSIKKIYELSKGYPKQLVKHFKEHTDQLRTNRLNHSPHRSPFNNRTSRGKHPLRKDNRSTPDLRTLSERKKGSEGNLMLPIVEESEKESKNKRYLPTFQLEDESMRLKSTSSVTEDEFLRGKKKKEKKMMMKTVSYSPQPQFIDKREILSPNITTSAHNFSSSEEESSEDESTCKYLRADSDEEEGSESDFMENLEEDEEGNQSREGNQSQDGSHSREEEVQLVKSYSNEHKPKDETASSVRMQSDDPYLRKVNSSFHSTSNSFQEKPRKRGQTTGKQGKKFRKNTKNKFRETARKSGESENFHESDEDDESNN